MLGLKKQAIRGRGGVKTLSFHTFGMGKRGSGSLRGDRALNCSCKGGRLRGGVGVKPYEDPSGNKLPVLVTTSNAAVYLTTSNTTGTVVGAGAQVYLLDKNGQLYLRNPSTTRAEQKIFLGPSVDHCALKTEEGKIYNLFCGTGNVVSTMDGTSFSSKLLDGMRGACILGKRYIMARYNGEIRYSAVFSPFEQSSSDPDGSGIIYLPTGYGEVVGMKEYAGEAYIFCEKGIFRLTVSANASNFTLKNIPYKGGNICLRSMAVSEKGIVFLASEGAYCVNGDSVKRICEYLDIGPCNVYALCATGYGNGFFMIDYTKQTEDGGESRRLVVDTDCEDAFFTDEYGALGENEYTLVMGQVGIFTKDEEGIRRGQTPYFTSVPLDFGTSKNKRLKSIRVRGSGGVTVTVQCGGVEHSYPLTFVDGEAKTRLMGKGKAVTLTFALKPWAVVEGVEIEYTVEG